MFACTRIPTASHHARSNEKLSCCRDSSRYDKMSDSGDRSANPNPKYDLCKIYSTSRQEKRGRPRKNWIVTTQQDLKSIGVTWKVVQQLAVNREGWNPSCIELCCARRPNFQTYSKAISTHKIQTE